MSKALLEQAVEEVAGEEEGGSGRVVTEDREGSWEVSGRLEGMALFSFYLHVTLVSNSSVF